MGDNFGGTESSKARKIRFRKQIVLLVEGLGLDIRYGTDNKGHYTAIWLTISENGLFTPKGEKIDYLY
ncbi:hypothetical protein THIOM_003580, partial [Candidatus Thiomargarita nelsonii]